MYEHTHVYIEISTLLLSYVLFLLPKALSSSPDPCQHIYIAHLVIIHSPLDFDPNLVTRETFSELSDHISLNTTLISAIVLLFHSAMHFSP